MINYYALNQNDLHKNNTNYETNVTCELIFQSLLNQQEKRI
jgi:hypothetical protein